MEIYLDENKHLYFYHLTITIIFHIQFDMCLSYLLKNMYTGIYNRLFCKMWSYYLYNFPYCNFHLQWNAKYFPGYYISFKIFLMAASVSVQFSRSVVSYSLWPHELQHARPPCPSPTPRVHPHPCPVSRWCHPAIWSSVIPFSSYPQAFPASGSFQMSQLSTSGSQSTGVSASTSVPPVNTHFM